MDRLQKIFLVAAATGCVALGSSFVGAGTESGRSAPASGEVGAAPVPGELDTEFLPVSDDAADPAVRPQSIARHFLMDANAGGGTSSDASAGGNGPKEAGIPGAIVAVIFGIFGLLVIARRSSTR